MNNYAIGLNQRGTKARHKSPAATSNDRLTHRGCVRKGGGKRRRRIALRSSWEQKRFDAGWPHVPAIPQKSGLRPAALRDPDKVEGGIQEPASGWKVARAPGRI